MDNLLLATILLIVGSIAGIGIVVVALIDFKNDNIKTKLIIGLIITTVIGLIGATVLANQPSDYEKKKDAEEQLRRDDCRSNTNAYRKCSWSVIEDRCVCKQR